MLKLSVLNVVAVVLASGSNKLARRRASNIRSNGIQMKSLPSPHVVLEDSVSELHFAAGSRFLSMNPFHSL
jgi:hypothetical protein